VNDTDTESSWLSEEDLATVRGRMPILYVHAVPVRTDAQGQVTQVGLLLRMDSEGLANREVVAGRVLFGEQIRDALLRHLEKDLGPLALPRIPAPIAPFTVVEYFPDPTISGFHDPRQHAVGLAYIVPVDGDCEPSQDALDLVWLTPDEVVSPIVAAELAPGHEKMVRRALAHVGRLP
jgi:ADP-ribose pyrophosphatase YjhB (NUDIX family)